MSETVLALILIGLFFVVVPFVSFFKTLDTGLWREARIPIVAGVVAGVLIRLADGVPQIHFLSVGVILTLAALYVRLMGRESEPVDGMILGAMTGVAASIPLVVTSIEGELLRFSECVLAGAAAGYGITVGVTHVRDKLRQLVVDVVTALAAIALAALPTLLVRTRLAERHVAIAVATLIPLLVVVTVFRQWPSIRAELRHEAALGFIDDDDVRPTAHPFHRLGRAGWHDALAHREFVRLANRIALRKLQQRGRSEDVARLYQLEVMKLRVELQEMARIDRAVRAEPQIEN